MLQRTVQTLAASVVALILAAACSSNSSPTAPVVEFNPIQPWSGSITGMGVVSTTSITCAAGTAPSTMLTGTGTLGILGPVTITAQACNRTLGATASTARVQAEAGIGVLAMGPGDTLFATYTGYFEADRNCTALTTTAMELTVTRGTGRYVGRTGTGQFRGTQVSSACPPTNNPVPLTTSGILSGVLFNKQ